ncbi:amidohydrolase/deacetylase family metallohydrolase [Bradyrhizobium sp. SSUT18]|uniref:amidohydrolase/deacetylase family metallohydrolase n=1 Tax=Bradyrhizobium sp. SSUT18 TaxID=3040602 RepID=UPI0024484DD5|nr:amidohydrolase/deacetylase family metallohydrolase [Bradyrhizobium sp. SSUT18]MDH2399937.1 amidohydrolase/deacetylase family metallohydrolase [Bradyrhizobium sp. SSUT18]
MAKTTRRRFLIGTSAVAGAALAGTTGFADTAQPYDLVIRGGDVIDPSQKLRGVRDVGIRYGQIAAVEPSIDPSQAKRTIDAKGKLVTPGLVDLHTHIYAYGSAIGIPPDELVPFSGTTTYVSAGDAGANNFSGFKRQIVSQSRSRVFAFVNISVIGLAGFPVGENVNIKYADADATARTIAENQDIVLGAKVRETLALVGDNGIEPLKRAIEAVELSGTKGRVMCHIGDAPGDLQVLVNQLRPGDILTHPYSSLGNNTVQNGKVLPALLEAKKRGVIIDVGHGAGSFNFDIAEAAIQQGLTFDTISSDVHVVAANTPSQPYLPWVLSKFLALGFSLEDVIAAATIKPATIIGKVPKLGTLQVGAPGDVSILELVEGPVQLLDTSNNPRTGKAYLKAVQTIREGVPNGRPYQLPFTVN